MINNIKFGPSGNGNLFYELGYKHSYQAPSWLRQLGLNAYEYSFGRGYTMSEQTAKKLGEEAEINNVLVSVHAPYYINFANESEEMAEKSYNYIIKGLEILKNMKGKHLVFHIGSQGKLNRSDAILLIKKRLKYLLKLIYEKELNDMYICPETMGKTLQIGTYKEIIDFCTMDKILVPTFDFGHIYSLNLGNFGSYNDYKEIFLYAIEKLGFERIDNCHIHFSKIQFGQKGEIRHLDFDNIDFGPNFEPLAKVLSELNLHPTIICESHSKMVEDSLEMKKIYEQINNSLQK